MSERVLVVNSGSSSVKYQLLAVTAGQRVAAGLIERVGEPGSFAGARTRDRNAAAAARHACRNQRRPPRTRHS